MAGINQHGVAVTINNLNTPTRTIGVLWPALVRMMLTCSSAADARELLGRVKVGSGHHYQIADANEFFGIEALAGQQRQIAHWKQGEAGQLTYEGAACHTNHCLDQDQAELEVLSPESTTFVRWNALADLLEGGSVDANPGAMWHLLSDERLSMKISEEEPHKSATCGGLVFDWTTNTPVMHVGRGPLTGQVPTTLNV